MRRLLEQWKMRGTVAWFRLTRKLEKPDFTGAIRKGGSGVRSALIILPEGRENSRIARYFLKSIYQSGHTEIDFLMDKSLYHTFQDSLPESVKVYEEDELNWFRLPSQAMLDRILDHPYDAVVDMHPVFNLSSAYLALMSKAPMRIGFSNKFSEHFFNVEIDNSKSEFLERSYLAVQKLLNL